MCNILGKTIINKKYNKIKTEVFFYPSVTANLSSGGTTFLFLVFLKVRLGLWELPTYAKRPLPERGRRPRTVARET